MIENLKTAIRPGLAIWAACMLTLSFLIQLPLELWIKFICGAILLEWVGERGIKRAKELLRN